MPRLRSIYLAVLAVTNVVPLASSREIFITPGPGLPSLESLGITPAELYNMSIAMAETHTNNPHPRPRKRSFCELPDPDFNVLPAGHGNVYACAIYLDSLGTTSCVAEGGSQPTIMCDASGQANEYPARVVGLPGGGITRSSYCRDAAWPVFWVLDNCQSFCVENKCGVSGYETARGNGDLTIKTFAPHF